MPWTFSHPAAVLPLKRLCPRYLSFPAMLVGALTPDLGYYIGEFGLARMAHTLSGAIVVCVPSGLLLLYVLAMLRDPLLFLLPSRHRQAIQGLMPAIDRLTLRSMVVVSVSIVLGAWSHIAWDALTHDGRWGQVQLPWLGGAVWSLGGAEIPIHAVLQHASTLFGALVLVLGYRRMLCGFEERRRSHETDLLGDRHRWNLILTMLFAAASIAVVTAGIAIHGETAWRAVHVFAFAAAIHGTVAFALLYTVTALMVYGQAGRRSE